MPAFDRFDIADGGVLLFAPEFLPAADADALLADLKAHVPWACEAGRFGPLPRLTAYYADAGVHYCYSGVEHAALPWPDFLLPINRRVAEAAGSSFNSLLLNYYRDGKDSMGYHADAEAVLGTNPVVPSLSLGATRTFHLRHDATRERLTFALSHGSLLVMTGTTQHHWKHTIPKTKKPVGERINLTYRNINPKT